MAYDADPAATHNPATGNTPSAGWGDIINANFAALGAAWTSYTPTLGVWTLNNGTITGKYRLIGKTLDLRIYFTVGSTTVTTAATPTFSLPGGVTAVAGNPENVLIARAYDDSAAANYSGTAYVPAGATTVQFTHLSGNTATITSTVPFTWAQNDDLTLVGTVEVA